jgi:hypothetical protein
MNMTELIHIPECGPRKDAVRQARVVASRCCDCEITVDTSNNIVHWFRKRQADLHTRPAGSKEQPRTKESMDGRVGKGTHQRGEKVRAKRGLKNRCWGGGGGGRGKRERERLRGHR